jgi:hypothetical protein
MGQKASAVLPLHGGKAPRWLFSRMVKLSECIIDIIINEYGQRGLLERLSDPWFFQSLSCLLGYDWHSSGTTTVTCGALKTAMDRQNMGVTVCGGKGRTSLRTPKEIREMAQIFGLHSNKTESLVYASKMSAKTDNTLIQDSYQLYHHCFFFTERGEWIVIQQGINEEKANARRYHWGLEQRRFTQEPLQEILCPTKLSEALNMTHRESFENQKTCLDLIRDNPDKLRKQLVRPVPANQSRLDKWSGTEEKLLIMPRSVNWDAVRAAYEFQPRTYEEFVSRKGIGAGTVRGLALVAELVYGNKASWKDPVKFNFAFGGKDGVPYPVDRKSMDEAVDVLKKGIQLSGLKRYEQKQAYNRLRKCIPESIPEKLKTVKIYQG